MLTPQRKKRTMGLRVPSTLSSRTYISARPMTQNSSSEILMRRSDGVSLAPLSGTPREHYLQWYEANRFPWGSHVNLVTDPQGVLRLWRKHFSTLLQGDDDTNTTFIDVILNPIDDDDVEIPSLSHEEVKSRLRGLKTIKRQVLKASSLNCLRPDVMSW